KSPAEVIAECRWAGLDESLMHLASAAWLRRTVPGERIVYRTNTLIGLVEAARAGIGVAVVPCFLGDREAGLRRIGDPLPELATELWLLIHEDLRNTARVRSFVDFMSRAIRLERPRLEGRPEASRASTP
ncbi:MAG TPA: LysR substrate-binding domain-containing protein, partial [Arenibaculum sp.]|nr:LysR substrate-binding domain-containing protein [Arenibaculum sp.]